MSKLILIADDYDHLAQAMANVIASEAHCETDWALNGHEAIEKAKRRRPNLVVLNIDMPLVNGIEAARTIKAIYVTAPPILVASTGKPIDAEVAEVGLFDLILEKPIKLDQLLRMVKLA